LPHSDFAGARGIYSGQAVRHLDNRTRIATFEGRGA
jgi:hypothetical protein